MRNVKTAVSLSESLFRQAEAVAEEMKISRSRLFGLALQEFLRRREDQRILDQLNEVYTGDPDPEDQELLRRMRYMHGRIVSDAW